MGKSNKAKKTAFLFFVMSFVILNTESKGQTTEQKSIQVTIDSLNNQGNKFFKNKKYDSAIAVLNRVLDLQKTEFGPNSPELGITYFNLGYNYKQQNKLNEAIELYKKALPLLEAKYPNSPVQSGITRYQIAEMYESIKDYANAIKWGEEAVVFLKKGVAPDDANLLATYEVIKSWKQKLGGIPDKPSGSGDIADSNEQVEKQHESSVTDSTDRVLSLLCDFIDSLKNSGDPDALKNELFRNKPATDTLVTLLFNFGVKHAGNNNFSLSLKYFSTAGTIYELVDTQMMARCLQWMGFCYLNSDDPDEAIANYSKALEIAKAYHNLQLEVWVTHDLGTAYFAKKKESTAKNLLEQALNLNAQLKDSAAEGSIKRHLAMYYKANKQFSEAVRLLNEAFLVGKAVGDTITQIATLYDLGEIYNDQLQYEKAYEYFTESKELAVKIGRQAEVAHLNLQLGNLYYIADNFDDALSCLHSARDFFLKYSKISDLLKANALITEIYKASPHSSKAYDLYLQSLALCQKYGYSLSEANVLNNLGNFLVDRNELDSAAVCFTHGFDISSSLNDNESSFATAYNLAYCYNLEKKPELALQWFKKADEFIQLLNKNAGEIGGFRGVEFFFAKREVLSTYRNIVELLLKDGKFEDALNYADKTKSTLFWNQANALSGMAKIEVDSALFAKEESLNNDLYAVSNELKETALPDSVVKKKVFQKRVIENDLLAINESFYHKNDKILRSPAGIRIDSLQRICGKEKLAFLEYFIGEKNVVLFLVAKNVSKKFYIPISHVALLDSVNMLLGPIWKQDLSGWNENMSYRTYCSLLKPALEYLKAQELGIIHDLVIVPDGILNMLPFEALVTNRSAGNTKYLIDQYAIDYDVSANNFIWRRDKQTGSGNYETELTAVTPYTNFEELGSSIQRLEDSSIAKEWQYLPNTIEEIENIASNFPNSRTVFNKDATKEFFRTKLKSSKFMHLATHGYLDDANPNYSGILLNDGLYKFYEILNSPFKTDMVVLSACQSAMGQIIGNEGVIGLPRAFLIVGAKSVVGSLWPVSDEATKDFMNEFYMNLAAGNSKAASLQKAKNWMRKESYHINKNNEIVKHDNPFYWAPFVLIGSNQ